jgi:serine/threonine protein phosphatase PrpC
VALSESAVSRYMSCMDFLRRRWRADVSGEVPARVDFGSATDTGPRPDNQDRCAVSPEWAIVSDGVGGHAGGGLAAELTVEAVVSVLVPPDASGDADALAPDEQLMRRVMDAANDAVRAGRRDDPAVADMGATLTVAAAVSIDPGESRWLVASVGDSPAWRVTATGAERLTHDHTLAAELARSGAITEADAARHPGRHIVIRSIGAEDRVDPDVTATALRPGEALVLVSDGLSDVVDGAEIHAITANAATAADAASRLVEAALRRDASDNVTAAVVRHVAVSTDAPDTDPHPPR